MALCPSTLAVVALVALALLAAGASARDVRPGFKHGSSVDAAQTRRRLLQTNPSCPDGVRPIYANLPSNGTTFTGCVASDVTDPAPVTASLTLGGANGVTCSFPLSVERSVDVVGCAFTRTYTQNFPCNGLTDRVLTTGTLVPPSGPTITRIQDYPQETYDCTVQPSTLPPVPTFTSGIVSAEDACSRNLTSAITATAGTWSNSPACAWTATTTFNVADCGGATASTTATASLVPFDSVALPAVTVPGDATCTLFACPTAPITQAQLGLCSWTGPDGTVYVNQTIGLWQSQFAAATPFGCVDVAGQVPTTTSASLTFNSTTPPCSFTPVVVGTGSITGANECGERTGTARILVRVCESCAQAGASIRSAGFWTNPNGRPIAEACAAGAAPFINNGTTGFYCLGADLETCIASNTGNDNWRRQLAATFANLFCPNVPNPLVPQPSRDPTFSTSALVAAVPACSPIITNATSCPAGQNALVTYFDVYNCAYAFALANQNAGTTQLGFVADCLSGIITNVETNGCNPSFLPSCF